MNTLHAGPYRLSRGGMIDRRTSVPFEFNSNRYLGYAGDSLASALLANGVRIVARSFKFHRPRGVFACGAEETGALLQLGEGERIDPCVRAPLVELTANLSARSHAGWPSVRFDVGRLLDVVHPLWAAGFYNKTFKWPSWRTYERFIRSMAGFGEAPITRDSGQYATLNAHCDLLVVGGGVAGLNAALEAGRAGARVILADQGPELGGEARWGDQTVDGRSAQDWLAHTFEQIRNFPDVQLRTRTTATGYYDHNVVTLLERSQSSRVNGVRERFWIVRTQRVVLATGTIEQPLIFANNDRPGIMLAGAARQYLRRYGVVLGSRPLIATNNDSGYLLAKDLREAGINVLGIADTRRQVPDTLRSLARSLSIDLFIGHIPIDTSGPGLLRKVTLGELSADASSIAARRVVDCDALAVSGGHNPSLHLFAQAGGKLAYDEVSGALSPTTHHAPVEIVGAAALRTPIGPRVSPVGKSARMWIDLLHDVTVADIELALRENYTSVEHVKRYTTVGMAVDQGKTSTVASLELIARRRGVAPADLGHTTLRPPFVPVTLGAIAGCEIGERFAPHRLLPLHDWHISHGAVMQEFGEWRRPAAYLHDDESCEQAITREAKAVRTTAGLFDASPLGKIEVRGPDALEFLDRFYINDLTTLQPLRVRYGLMLRESGAIFDDGTIVILDRDRVVITTTSGNAGRVARWLEEWRQCEWPTLRVVILPVTEQWATVSLAGPRSREILGRLRFDIDLSAHAFPHLTMRHGNLLGAPARISRVSFTGELTYEICVPTRSAQSLWDALLNAGREVGLQPLGMDALLLLRLEKGFLHVGTDTDGTTVPDDVGWGETAARKQRDYIGKRSLRLAENVRADRLQLVGLSGEKERKFVIGAHLRSDDSRHATEGWITSAGTSVLTHTPIALALLRQGRSRLGTEINVCDAGSVVGRARVVNPPFFDPTGARARA